MGILNHYKQIRPIRLNTACTVRILGRSDSRRRSAASGGACSTAAPSVEPIDGLVAATLGYSQGWLSRKGTDPSSVYHDEDLDSIHSTREDIVQARSVQQPLFLHYLSRR
jgi:hypothetical protein